MWTETYRQQMAIMGLTEGVRNMRLLAARTWPCLLALWASTKVLVRERVDTGWDV